MKAEIVKSKRRPSARVYRDNATRKHDASMDLTARLTAVCLAMDGTAAAAVVLVPGDDGARVGATAVQIPGASLLEADARTVCTALALELRAMADSLERGRSLEIFERAEVHARAHAARVEHVRALLESGK